MVKFLILIVAIVIIKFLYDTFTQSSKIKSEGGVRRKYSTLVNYFLSSDQRCRIYQETNTFVSVGISGAAGSQMYYISPAYGNVSIRMEIKNNPMLGNKTKEWTFPENMDQNEMIRRIESDIQSEMESFVNRFK